MPDSLYSTLGKRCFDFCASLSGLIILSPFFLLISALIKLSDGGPVFFSQTRIGRNFKPFRLLKFRSMVLNADKIGPSVTAGDDPRITKIGKFIRKTKIDELPQLFNVLKGDISIIGPRPEVSRYVEIFKDEYKEILKLKPGITDYATIEFRNEEELLKKFDDHEEAYIREILPRKIELYNKYLRSISFGTDIKLFFWTLWRIIA